jgi:hypothetical protein
MLVGHSDAPKAALVGLACDSPLSALRLVLSSRSSYAAVQGLIAGLHTLRQLHALTLQFVVSPTPRKGTWPMFFADALMPGRLTSLAIEAPSMPLAALHVRRQRAVWCVGLVMLTHAAARASARTAPTPAHLRCAAPRRAALHTTTQNLMEVLAGKKGLSAARHLHSLSLALDQPPPGSQLPRFDSPDWLMPSTETYVCRLDWPCVQLLGKLKSLRALSCSVDTPGERSGRLHARICACCPRWHVRHGCCMQPTAA